ncbi:MAG: chorismate-binding protein [Bacteroidota bacterium]
MRYPENKGFPILLDKVKNAITHELPFCLYRKPNQEEVKAIFQESNELYFSKDFEDSGFVFAPFDLNNDTILIKPDKIVSSSYKKGDTKHKTAEPEPIEKDKSTHLDLVKEGLNAIAQGRLEKVVLSKKIAIERQTYPEKIIIRLLDTYPSAFCYLFYHPEVGIWCGASPETFLQLRGNKLKTMSLAGTLPYQSDIEPKWGKKELDEQKMVTDFIEDRLSNKVDEIKTVGPENSKAGLLWHLKTEITASVSSKSSLKDIIKVLHPTPAVCGLPFDKAKIFILENETYDRTFYTGFLGELNMGENKDSSLYVNLRCMELTSKGASIYVGGGVTADSIPENEWDEIQSKSKTMLRLL